jgi:PadR family transcriptional regulator PadR
MKFDKSLLTGSTTLLVLSLLRSGDKYGYEMIAELLRRSDGTFELKEGTLYPLLHALENKKCISSYLNEAESGRIRKYYHLSEKGHELLTDKTEEWDLFSSKVNAVVFGAMPLNA